MPERRLTLHHLRTKKADPHLTIRICRECHSTIHRFYTNRELAAKDSPLASLEGLLAQEKYAKAVAWIARQDPGRHPRIRNSKSKGLRAAR